MVRDGTFTEEPLYLLAFAKLIVVVTPFVVRCQTTAVAPGVDVTVHTNVIVLPTNTLYADCCTTTVGGSITFKYYINQTVIMDFFISQYLY